MAQPRKLKIVVETKLVFQVGFKVTEDSETDEAQGIVIEDSKGNQFVWIPVKNASDFTRNLSYPGYNDGSALSGDAGGLPEGGYSSEQVANKGGFYVSRFWITKDSNGILVSKKGMDALKTNTQIRANHITSLRSFINTPYAKTSLISGIAYDVMMNFVNNKRYSKGIFNVNEVQPGISFTTGASEDAKVCNIYDLATPVSGNSGSGVLTSELGSVPNLTNWAVVRGYSIGLGTYCPSYRGYGGNNLGLGHGVVRATLYVY